MQVLNNFSILSGDFVFLHHLTIYKMFTYVHLKATPIQAIFSYTHTPLNVGLIAKILSSSSYKIHTKICQESHFVRFYRFYSENMKICTKYAVRMSILRKLTEWTRHVVESKQDWAMTVAPLALQIQTSILILSLNSGVIFVLSSIIMNKTAPAVLRCVFYSF